MTLALKIMDEREEALQQGLEQGLKQGLEQGLEKGLEKGIQTKQLEVCREALEMNLPIDAIAKLTGMSVEEIRAVAEKR